MQSRHDSRKNSNVQRVVAHDYRHGKRKGVVSLTEIRRAELHGHTVKSQRDAITKIKNLVKKAKERGLTAVAVTEHGYLFSTVELYQECKAQGMKPIMGFEAYYCTDRDTDNEHSYHLVVLAKNEEGYRNLIRLASDAGMNKTKLKRFKPGENGKPGKYRTTNIEYPRIDDKSILKYGKGLIATSACLGGIIPRLLLESKYDEAKERALFFNSAFDMFALEVQPHSIADQILVNSDLVRLSQDTGIPLVMTSDYHYIDASEKEYHDVLMAIGNRSPYTVSAHLRTTQEMVDYCHMYNIPVEAVSNSALIADHIDFYPLEPKDRQGLMPTFKCPPGYSEESYLRKLTFDYLIDMAPVKGITDIKGYVRQANYELDIICSMGFAGYFLILWDWFLWCRDNGILMGKGRGSAAGSVVSYALKITTIDPIKNGYYFERFLNPERFEPPDVDSDISKEDRPRAIRYLLDKYGEDYVAQIVTFTYMKLKSSMKHIGSAVGIPNQDINDLTKIIPQFIDGKDPTLDSIFEITDDPDSFIADLGIQNVNSIKKCGEKLREFFLLYPKFESYIRNLTGCVSGVGIHAGGVVVSGKPLSDHIPLMTGSDTAVLPLVQEDMEGVTFHNALKIDALGLATLTQVQKAMSLIGLDYDWFDSEDFSDPEVYAMLREGLTQDVFQMGKHGATKMIRDMKVDSFEGLTIVNAGNRPGPLSKDPTTGKSLVDQYVANRASNHIPEIHPDIDPILNETLGCLWYQEQCMDLGKVMAGYSLGKADLRIRKVLGKKKVEKIPEIEAEFVYGKTFDKNTQQATTVDSENCVGSIRRGFSEDLSHKIFDIMKDFAKYCFNKAHSGAYAALAYKTAWLKKYYTAEWTIACLYTHDKTEKVVATLGDARRMGITILPPDINKSDANFKIEIQADGSKALRYGLNTIPWVSERVVEFIGRYRPFTDFDDFFHRIHSAPRDKDSVTGKLMNNPLNKRVEDNLISAGAFDEFDDNRYRLKNYYMQQCRKEKNYTPLRPSDFKLKVKLQMEKDIMGLYVSEHPLDKFPYQNLSECLPNEEVQTSGIIKKVNVKKIGRGQHKGEDFASVLMETKDSQEVRVMVFTEVYNKYKDRLKKDSIIIVDGTYNMEFNNIQASVIRKLVRKKKTQAPVVNPMPAKGNPHDPSMGIPGGIPGTGPGIVIGGQ